MPGDGGRTDVDPPLRVPEKDAADVRRIVGILREEGLLDECTSSLDAETEEKLLLNLRKMTDRTVLIVTHRKAALSICDKIVEFTADGCKIRKSLDSEGK